MSVCACGWVDLLYCIWKHFPWPHLSENLTFSPFLDPDCIVFNENACIDICVSVCVSLMLQERCSLIRTSLPTHPNYPHNPLAGETACNSLPRSAVAKRCSSTLTVWIHWNHNHSSVYEIMWHTCVCLHALVWWTHKSFFSPLLQRKDQMWKVESLGCCLWNREERYNELTCTQVERLQGCLCFYSESSCVLIDLASLQRV